MTNSGRLGYPWRQAIALIELVNVFLLILVYIWWLRDGWSWLMILAVTIGSHLCYHEDWRQLGFWPEDFKKVFAGVFNADWAPAVFMTVFSLVLFGSQRPITWPHSLINLGQDCAFGLLQQYLLCGYFVNRLASFNLGDDHQASIPWIAAGLFSLAHLPNQFLMIVTAIGGFTAVKVFLRYRNLWFLALAHGIIKFCLFLVTTDRWPAYGFKVGPKCLVLILK